MHNDAPATQPGSKATCAHCLQPVPNELLTAGDEPQFCCSGCRTVHAALSDHGLLSYYTKRSTFEEGTSAAIGRATEHSYAHFDDLQFISSHATVRGDLVQIEMYLEGLHCPACIWLVEKLPTLLEGVLEARSSFAEGRLRVIFDPRRSKLSEIAQTLDSLGYPPHPAGNGRNREAQRRLDRALLVRIGVAAAAFGNVMLLSFALYSGEAQGMSASTEQFFRWLSFLIAVPSVLWTASTFLRGARSAVVTRTPHMDLPVSIGILAALGWGTWATFSGDGHIYFDTVTMLVFLLLVGRWLQGRQQRIANEATDLMFALAPSTSRVIAGDEIKEVPTDTVDVDALVEVRSGERIGVDGVVIDGSSEIDESLLSGESNPVRARTGDVVNAGTVNLSGRLLVRATRTGRDTRLAKLVKEVEEAAARKAPIVMLADRLSGVFVVVVMALAAVTLAIWGIEDGLQHAIALLIVTCPCALGLATPLAASVALGRAAKHGALIKGMQYLEALAKPGLIVFDKTGTLTTGGLAVVDYDGDAQTAALIRAAETHSSHPLAKALLRDLPLSAALVASSHREETGLGVVATIDGKQVVVGSARLAERHCQLDRSSRRSRELIARGLSPVYVVVDGQLRACVGIGDTLRPDARRCLLELRQRGYELAILSGDRQEVVDHVVAQLGLPFRTAVGQQSPENKLHFVEDERRRGVVYMVGDGVNDAAALAAATVGIAVQGGAEASLAAADVFTTQSGLTPLLMMVRGARKTMSVIYRNLGFSLIYNLAAAALAVAGVVSPLIAAVLMPLSSLTVLTNSFRSQTFEDPS